MISNGLIDDELIDEIGESLGYYMWNKRDMTKEYGFAGARDPENENEISADGFCSGTVIYYNKIPLLVFKNMYLCYFYKDSWSEYTLNLRTLKPTKNSKNQTQFSNELIRKITKYQEREYQKSLEREEEREKQKIEKEERERSCCKKRKCNSTQLTKITRFFSKINAIPE